MQNAPLTRDRLVDGFHAWGIPRSAWRVGVEIERHLLLPDGYPVPYFGEQGVRWLLDQFIARGWKPHFEGDHLIAAVKDDAWITLEPGSQYELSTAPFTTVRAVEAQARQFTTALDEALESTTITPVALGYTPFASMSDIPWVPKGRYVVMREYLAQTGTLAHEMMKGTCATQASFDFSDEADCARKVQLGTLLGPLTTAMFANSPITGGQPNGWASYRGHIWTQTDPRRTGFPESATNFTFAKWVDYLLDAPMMFLRIEGQWRHAHGVTFRQWMEQGIDGVFPDHEAWDLHLTSVFPEVRIKRLVEVRGADCVSHHLAMAFTAYFRGLFYDDRSLDQALDIGAHYAALGTTASRFDVGCRDGLAGTHGGRRLSAWAEDLVDLARDGLTRLGDGDQTLLAPLEAQVASGESPAAALLRAWRQHPHPASLVAATRYSAENQPS